MRITRMVQRSLSHSCCLLIYSFSIEHDLFVFFKKIPVPSIPRSASSCLSVTSECCGVPTQLPWQRSQPALLPWGLSISPSRSSSFAHLPRGPCGYIHVQSLSPPSLLGFRLLLPPSQSTSRHTLESVQMNSGSFFLSLL